MVAFDEKRAWPNMELDTNPRGANYNQQKTPTYAGVCVV
jgi:hypothetical protein